MFTLIVLPLEKAVGGQHHQVTRMKLHTYRRIGVERRENAERERIGIQFFETILWMAINEEGTMASREHLYI